MVGINQINLKKPCRELIVFTEEFGNCNIPLTDEGGNPSMVDYNASLSPLFSDPTVNPFEEPLGNASL